MPAPTPLPSVPAKPDSDLRVTTRWRNKETLMSSGGFISVAPGELYLSRSEVEDSKQLAGGAMGGAGTKGRLEAGAEVLRLGQLEDLLPARVAECCCYWDRCGRRCTTRAWLPPAARSPPRPPADPRGD